jgi:hypothetical protein
MADSGAMNEKLISFPKAAALQWHRLTSYINPSNYNQITTLIPSALTGENSAEDILAAYQMAFLKVIVCQPELLASADMETWKGWIQAFYSADQRVISKHPALFSNFVDLLILHQELIPEVYLSDLTFVKKGTMDFVGKLESIGDVSLSLKAKQYQFFVY